MTLTPVRLTRIAVLAVALGLTALLLMMQPASGPVEAIVTTGPDFSMAIDLDGGGDDCDTRTGGVGTTCEVPFYAKFSVKGNVDGIPGIGYAVFSFNILHNNTELTRDDRASVGEAGSPTYWPAPPSTPLANMCPAPGGGSFTTEVVAAASYRLECWPSPDVDSAHKGQVIEVDFICTTIGQSVITQSDTGTFMHDANHTTLADSEGNETLTIDCVKDPDTDTDGDTTPNGTDTDDDNDGCEDVEEGGQDKALGGLRNSHNFWDFFDVPTGMPLARDQAVAGTDFFGLLGRFGAEGDETADPLSTPPAAPAYHPAFDRGGADPDGPFTWSLLPADGTIAGTDFFSILGQFGDSCAGAP